MTVQIESEQHADSLLNSLPAEFETIEDCLSRFRPHSELMRFNAQAGQWVNVSPTLYENIQAAKHAARLTDGLFNPLVLHAMIANGYSVSFDQLDHPAVSAPAAITDWQSIELRRQGYEVRIPSGTGIDLGGIAKGWMANQVADRLAKQGACLVNIGGDMAARGVPEGYSGWPVTVEDPLSGETLINLRITDGAIVTSGIDYRRWVTADGHQKHHIIHPDSGKPAETDVLTVTVIHPSATIAEAYAKAVLLLGYERGLAWLNQQWNAAGLVVLRDASVISSTNFHGFTDLNTHSDHHNEGITS